jgi:hypothetical protein
MKSRENPSRTTVRNFAADMGGRRGTIDRADYLIDRFRVRYAFGGGWSCSCTDFVAHDACKHTREAAGRHAAQARIALHLQGGSSDSFTLHDRAHAR